MNNSERSTQDAQFYMVGEDLHRTLIAETQTITITPEGIRSEGITIDPADLPTEQDVIVTLEQALTQVPAAPEAQTQEGVQISKLEKVLNAFSEVEEGNLFSNNVNLAIKIFSESETLEQAIELMRAHPSLNFKNLLFNQIDIESRELNRFMQDMQRIPSLPSHDVDFI